MIACLTSTAGWALQACIGIPRALTTPADTSRPIIDLRVGGKTGPWLIDFGSTFTFVSSVIWQPTSPDGLVELDGLDFPGVEPGLHPYVVMRGVPAPPFGTIGTDLLEDVTTEIHFEDAGRPYLVFSTLPCLPQLAARTTFRIRQPDFFGSMPRSAGKHPNVPVVFIELEQRAVRTGRPAIPDPPRVGRTWAQIDTGSDDGRGPPYSVDINEPYLRQIERLVPSLRKVGQVEVTGCDGETSTRAEYAAPGWALEILNEKGERLPKRFDDVRFDLAPKQTACGGIGPLSEPAAKLDASFLRAFGTTIFMPATSDVWIATP